MSPCPKCGVVARHVAVWVPWPGVSGPVQVVHECVSAGCSVFRFFEPVEDLVAVEARVSASFMRQMVEAAATGPRIVGGGRIA